jgi:NAD(P)-dependent dehydrogenase (short-subunit alcohol dehydrogenase family)
MEFQGKAALITGGGSGIGEGLALEISKRGGAVSVVDIDIAQAQRVVSKGREGGEARHAASFMFEPPTRLQ